MQFDYSYLDIAFKNGSVITVNDADEVAEAVGIKGNKIVFVGSNEEIDKLMVKENVPELVYTTGEILAHPCVHTVIPDYVDFSIDVRHENPEIIKKVYDIVHSLAGREWAKCRCEVADQWNRDTVYWNKELVGYVREAVEELGIPHQDIHSGAGHDAQFASYMLPTTMIFVASEKGLSHCEPEHTSDEICTKGASVLLNAVLKCDAAD